MYHIMKQASVRDLRYHFAQIEARLARGEQIEVRKRRKVIARLVPVGPKAGAYPDFSRVRKRIFADKKMSQTGTQIVAEERGRY